MKTDLCAPVPQKASKPGKLGLDRFLTYRLHVLNKITDRVTDELYQRETGLSLSDCRCIAAIGHFVPLSINDLAAHANLDKSQASRAAQKLVNSNIASRTSRAHDNRGVDLVLTKVGQTIYEQIIQIATQRNDDVFSCLSKPERELFSSLLDRLVSNAKSNVKMPAKTRAITESFTRKIRA